MSSAPVQRAIAVAKQVWYAGRGEKIEMCGHRLRYLPGTRPVRLKYRNDPDMTVRNDVRQLEFICDNVKPGDVVLDVGANVGQYAILFGALVGVRGQVFAFEPEPSARKRLEANVSLNNLQQRVKIERFAVCDAEGERNFYSRAGDMMSSLSRAGFGTNADRTDIRETIVQAVSIDGYLTSNSLPDPQWLKIDAEGAEIKVLRGATRALSGNTKIICELHPYAWKSFGDSFEDLILLATRFGRAVRFLDESRNIHEGPAYGAVLIER